MIYGVVVYEGCIISCVWTVTSALNKQEYSILYWKQVILVSSNQNKLRCSNLIAIALQVNTRIRFSIPNHCCSIKINSYRCNRCGFRMQTDLLQHLESNCQSRYFFRISPHPMRMNVFSRMNCNWDWIRRHVNNSKCSVMNLKLNSCPFFVQ